MMERLLQSSFKAVTPYFLDLCAFPFFFPVNQKSVEGNDDWANDASDKFSYKRCIHTQGVET